MTANELYVIIHVTCISLAQIWTWINGVPGKHIIYFTTDEHTMASEEPIFLSFNFTKPLNIITTLSDFNVFFCNAWNQFTSFGHYIFILIYSLLNMKFCQGQNFQ